MTLSAEQPLAPRKLSAPSRLEDRRKIRRSKIFVPLILTMPHGEVRAHLLDIGTGGALCFSETQPQFDSIVDICWYSTRWAARVIWINGRRFGLRFLSPLSLESVQGVIEDGARRKRAHHIDQAAATPSASTTSPPIRTP